MERNSYHVFRVWERLHGHWTWLGYLSVTWKWGSLILFIEGLILLEWFRVCVRDSHNLAELHVQQSIAPPIHSGVSHNATFSTDDQLCAQSKGGTKKSCLGKSGWEFLEVPFHTAEMLSQYLQFSWSKEGQWWHNAFLSFYHLYYLLIFLSPFL